MGGLRLFFVSSLALVSVMLNVPSSKAEAAQTVIFSKKVVRQTERFPEGRPFTFIELIQKPGLHSSMEEYSKKGEIGELMAGSFDGRDSDELSFDELIDGEPEYSRWNGRHYV